MPGESIFKIGEFYNKNSIIMFKINYHYIHKKEKKVRTEGKDNVLKALHSKRTLSDKDPLNQLPKAQFAWANETAENKGNKINQENKDNRINLENKGNNGYTGLVAMEFKKHKITTNETFFALAIPMSDDAETVATAEMISKQPEVILTFIDDIRDVIVVVAAYTLPDGSLPKTVNEARLFHSKAYIAESQHIKILTAFELLPNNEGIEHLIPLTPTKATWLNENVKPAVMSQPTRPVEESILRNALNTDNVDAGSLMNTIIEKMPQLYQFRRNEMNGSLEYYQDNMYILGCQPVTKQVINTITIEVQMQGITAWDRDIKRYLESNFVKTYNPITEYIYMAKGKWDGKDRITDLASRVPNDNPRWAELFHRWMLSAVAQWLGLNKNYSTTVVPLLIGNQAYGKSTFCRQLLPPELRNYYLERLEFSNKKEVERALSAFALINIDEYDSISKQQTAFLKHILQKTNVIGRDPYASTYSDHKRYAAFMATTNAPTPLIDPTGSRRYLCIKTTGKIDNDTPIEYEQVYGQLAMELYNGERSYFDSADEAYIQQYNLTFQTIDAMEEVFLSIFSKPQDPNKGEWMSVAHIIKKMHGYSKAVPENHSSYVRIGKILNRLGYQHKRCSRGISYFVQM